MSISDSCFFPLELGSTDSSPFPPSLPLQLDDSPTFFSLQVCIVSPLSLISLPCVCVYVCVFSQYYFADHVYMYVCDHLQEIMEETPEAEAEIYGKVLFYLRALKSMEKLNRLIKQWIVFRLKMDNYEAHLCQTSWSTPFGKPSGIYISTQTPQIQIF